MSFSPDEFLAVKQRLENLELEVPIHSSIFGLFQFGTSQRSYKSKPILKKSILHTTID
jgi:5,10-methylenetetrahydrofolate reductase